jgi:hypothetical protein
MSDEKQPVQYYDLKAARASGISDEDILNQLAQTHNYDLAGAREHGVSDSDILSTLIATKPPAEPVIEKESPEIMGGIGATAGVLGAAGDVIYSKGRPLIRLAEKAMGREPSIPLPKQRAFLDPSAVAEQAIARRTAPSVDVTGSPSAVRNWGVSQHEGEFLGGKEYSEADKIKKEALAFEKANPGHKVMPGSLLAVPEHEARNVAQKRAELAAQEDALKQAEVQAVAQKRAERLGERSALKQQQTKYDVAKKTSGLLGKVALPIVGGYQLGSQGAQAYNRLTRPDLTARDVLSGATNVVGAGTGALSMVPNTYINIKGVKIPTRIPAAIASQAAGTLANILDKRNPRDEIVEEKAAGGKVGTLVELLNLIKNKGGTAAAKRLEKAADLVPNLEHQYQPQALQRAFTGDNAQAVMVMNPKDFEKYAAPIDTGYKSSVMQTYGIGDPEKYGGYNAMPKGTYQDYLDYLGKFTRPDGGGLSDVPYLQLGQELNSSFPAVLGHEGRHRTAALEKLGDQSTLVRMMPRAALREPFPRRSQEEYLKALTEQIGQKPFVKPQVFKDDAGKDVRRGLIEFPEMFKKGGKTKKK